MLSLAALALARVGHENIAALLLVETVDDALRSIVEGLVVDCHKVWLVLLLGILQINQLAHLF